VLTTLRGKDFIATQDWTTEELDALVEASFDLKRRFALGEPTRLLRDKTLFMIFFDKSTRTRNAFEAGMNTLDGNAHDLNMSGLQISRVQKPHK
jgi:ornithine carbamoyltransferase